MRNTNESLGGKNLPSGEKVLARLHGVKAKTDQDIEALGHMPERAYREEVDLFLVRYEAWSKTRDDLRWRQETANRAIRSFGPFRYLGGEPFVKDTMDVLESLHGMYRSRNAAARSIGEMIVTTGEDTEENQGAMYAFGVTGAFAQSQAELIGSICHDIMKEERGIEREQHE